VHEPAAAARKSAVRCPGSGPFGNRDRAGAAHEERVDVVLDAGSCMPTCTEEWISASIADLEY